jgi:peptidoglycan/LPS O-acetylase OafA/YrhL
MTQMGEPAPGGRILTLDAVRVIAAMMVVFHHSLRATPGLDAGDLWSTPLSGQWWVGFLFARQAWVSVFFVLSGTVLALKAGRSAAPFSIPGFYAERLLRIYPLYLICLLASFAFRPLYAALATSGSSDWLSPQFLAPVGWQTWLSCLTFTSNFTGGTSVLNNVLWMMPILVQCYLLFPLVREMACARPVRRGVGAVAAFCAVALIIERLLAIPGHTVTHVWEFAGGVLMGVHHRALAARLRERRVLFAASLLCVGAYLGTCLGIRSIIDFLSLNLLNGLFGTSLVLLALCAWPPWSPGANMGRWLRRLSLATFGVFLFHNLFLGFFAPLLRKAALPAPLHFFALFAVVAVGAFSFSSWLTERVEKATLRIDPERARREEIRLKTAGARERMSMEGSPPGPGVPGCRRQPVLGRCRCAWEPGRSSEAGATERRRGGERCDIG